MGTVDDMSGGGGGESRVRYLGATDSYKMLYYPKQHSTNLTRDKSSRRQFYEKVGDQSLVHNIDSWIVDIANRGKSRPGEVQTNHYNTNYWYTVDMCDTDSMYRKRNIKCMSS